jgi:hypothetical protein
LDINEYNNGKTYENKEYKPKRKKKFYGQNYDLSIKEFHGHSILI